jgi:hypothetical protein
MMTPVTSTSVSVQAGSAGEADADALWATNWQQKVNCASVERRVFGALTWI